jgi:serine/threonine protein kinase
MPPPGVEHAKPSAGAAMNISRPLDTGLPAPLPLKRGLTKHVVTRWYRAPEVRTLLHVLYALYALYVFYLLQVNTRIHTKIVLAFAVVTLLISMRVFKNVLAVCLCTISLFVLSLQNHLPITLHVSYLYVLSLAYRLSLTPDSYLLSSSMPSNPCTHLHTVHVQVILAQPYTAAVDMWSLGCIFAELLGLMKENIQDYRKRRALFPGERYIHIHSIHYLFVYEHIREPPLSFVLCCRVLV